jgi:hypothetical protein
MNINIGNVALGLMIGASSHMTMARGGLQTPTIAPAHGKRVALENATLRPLESTGKETDEHAGLKEFYRLTSCARGGLPMEVQFVVVDNPPRSEASELTAAEIDRVIAKLDIKVASLLKDAGRTALESHSSIGNGRGSGPMLEARLSEAIVSKASEAFGLSFCGDDDSVGGSVFADLAMYFSRIYVYGNGGHPKWFDNLGADARNHATGILMLAVGLKLAGVDYDLRALLRSFEQTDRRAPFPKTRSRLCSGEEGVLGAGLEGWREFPEFLVVDLCKG